MTHDDTAGWQHGEAIDTHDLIELYGLSDEDRRRIADFGARIGDAVASLVPDFYDWLPSAGPWFRDLLSDPELVKRGMAQQVEYWDAFFKAEVDDDYVWRRRVVGEVHARIGLPLAAYFGAMNQFHREIAALVRQSDVEDADVGPLMESIGRLLALDTAVVVDTYNDIVEETLSEQASSLLAMSTPVTEIWEGVLFLPIVGLIDSHRAREIMNNTLAKISESQAQIFILDISGVGVVDTAVANNLIRITKATKLMGCESIISGVSPAIAQTMVDLGIDVGRIRTTATMRDALAVSFQRVGLQIDKRP
jgi:rsbT co-antagonist protein RsbR